MQIIEPKMVSYEEFPQEQATSEGVKTIETNRNDWCVVYKRDIPCQERDGMTVDLQVIHPEFSDLHHEKFPCVIYIQGSAWMEQDVYFAVSRLSHFAARGFVIASVRYRHTGIAPFPAQIEDAKAAVRFMRMNAESFNADPDNIFIWGDSSGGHTALMAGLTDGLPGFDNDSYDGVSAHVNAIVEFFAPTDIAKMCLYPSTQNHIAPDSPEGLLIGGFDVLENPERVRPTVIPCYVSAEREIPPVLMFHGDKDMLVPFSQALFLYDRLRECGKDVTLYRMRGAEHGSPVFWTEEVMDIIEDFLNSHMEGA